MPLGPPLITTPYSLNIPLTFTLEVPVKEFPPITAELMAALEQAFPDKLPRAVTITNPEFAAKIGEQTVLDFLRTRFALQNRPGRSI